MRPRISQPEAKFILEKLKRDKADLETQLSRNPSKPEADNLNGHHQATCLLISKYEILATGEKQRGRYAGYAGLLEAVLSVLGY